jgi:threonyl-tRNA synthetase
MLHRSLVGTMERLFAHLIEVHGGAFPAWYAPVQLVALPVNADQDAAADRLVSEARAAGLRAEVDRDGSVANRIRLAAKVPYVAVIGPHEAPRGEVALRLRDGRQLPPMPAPAALALIGSAVASRSLSLLPE